MYLLFQFYVLLGYLNFTAFSIFKNFCSKHVYLKKYHNYVIFSILLFIMNVGRLLYVQERMCICKLFLEMNVDIIRKAFYVSEIDRIFFSFGVVDFSRESRVLTYILPCLAEIIIFFCELFHL